MGILGLYFLTIYGTVIVVRTAGHTPLYSLLHTLIGYLLVLGPVSLLVIGLLSTLKGPRSSGLGLLLRLILILVIAAVPFLVHIATIFLTYTAGSPPQRTMWGPLSANEWFFMLLGCALFIAAILILFRLRCPQIVQPD